MRQPQLRRRHGGAAVAAVAVDDETDMVDGFVRGAGGDENFHGFLPLALFVSIARNSHGLSAEYG